MASSRKPHRTKRRPQAGPFVGLISIAGLALGLGGCTDPVGPAQGGAARGGAPVYGNAADGAVDHGSDIRFE